jgi:hypothetical protein
MSDSCLDVLVDEILADFDNDNKSWRDIVQIGDWVDSWSTGTYTFSLHQYKTEGKLYQVRELDFRKNPLVIVDGDYFDPFGNGQPEKVWLGPSRVVIRDGKIVWESSLEKSIKAMPPEKLAECNQGRKNPLMPFNYVMPTRQNA